MNHLIQALERIRDDYAHDRNAWACPPAGEAEKYGLLYADAQEKVDALNLAISQLRGEP
jgi:hypothetical protein